MHLTPEDIKIIKGEALAGYIFSCIVFCFGALFNLIYLLISEDGNYIFLLLTDVFLLFLVIFIPFRMNRLYREDLERGIKIHKLGTVELKENTVNYEAGSGSVYIPVLGDLFPKLWGQKMKSGHEWYLIINSTRYEVAESVFRAVEEGDMVKMYYPAVSNTLLGIEEYKD